MIKRFFIRFFADKDAKIPVNSELVFDRNADVTMDEAVKATSVDILTWMSQYPNGKVDFVWL
jgi:hypothetical protein